MKQNQMNVYPNLLGIDCTSVLKTAYYTVKILNVKKTIFIRQTSCIMLILSETAVIDTYIHTLLSYENVLFWVV